MSIRLFPDKTQDQPYLPVGCVEKIFESLPGLALSALRMCSRSSKEAVDAQLWHLWKRTLTRLEVNTSIIDRSSGELARRIFPLMKRITDNTQPILRKFWELNRVICRVCRDLVAEKGVVNVFDYGLWRYHASPGLPTWEDLSSFTSDTFDYVQEDARIKQLCHELYEADSRDALKRVLESFFPCEKLVWPVVFVWPTVIDIVLRRLLRNSNQVEDVERRADYVIYLQAWVLRFLRTGRMRDEDRFLMVVILCQGKAHTDCLELIQTLYNFNPNSLDKLEDFVFAAARNSVSVPIITWLLKQGYVSLQTRQHVACRALEERNCESAIRLACAPGLPIVQRLLTMGSFVCDQSKDILEDFLQRPGHLGGALLQTIAQAIDVSWDSSIIHPINCLLASVSDLWDQDRCRAVVVIIASQSVSRWSLIDDLLRDWGPVADEAAALAAANLLWHVPDGVVLLTVNLLLSRKFHEVVAAKDYIMHHHPKCVSAIALHQRTARADIPSDRDDPFEDDDDVWV